jgi:hypothetical protein
MLTEQDLTMKVRGSPSTIQIKPQTLKEIIKVKYILAHLSKLTSKMAKWTESRIKGTRDDETQHFSRKTLLASSDFSKPLLIFHIEASHKQLRAANCFLFSQVKSSLNVIYDHST